MEQVQPCHLQKSYYTGFLLLFAFSLLVLQYMSYFHGNPILSFQCNGSSISILHEKKNLEAVAVMDFSGSIQELASQFSRSTGYPNHKVFFFITLGGTYGEKMIYQLNMGLMVLGGML